jgi:hypothetical protein
VEVRVDMTYRYPHAGSSRDFDDLDGEASTAQVFTLAERGAGGAYRASFSLAILGGVLLFLYGAGLSFAAHRQVVAARRR